jgi:hypothetical protein
MDQTSKDSGFFDALGCGSGPSDVFRDAVERVRRESTIFVTGDDAVCLVERITAAGEPNPALKELMSAHAELISMSEDQA